MGHLHGLEIRNTDSDGADCDIVEGSSPCHCRCCLMHMGNKRSLHANRALAWIQVSRNRCQKRRLATTRWADNGDRFAAIDSEVHVSDNLQSPKRYAQICGLYYEHCWIKSSPITLNALSRISRPSMFVRNETPGTDAPVGITRSTLS